MTDPLHHVIHSHLLASEAVKAYHQQNMIIEVSLQFILGLICESKKYMDNTKVLDIILKLVYWPYICVKRLTIACKVKQKRETT